ncbi:MAG: glycosyl transferase [Pseudomonadota bacterium]
MSAPHTYDERVEGPHKLLVFGFDAAEAAQRRRIRAFLECGYDVQGFTMRRSNMTHDAAPFWPNVDLGETQNAAMGQRLRRIAASLPILRANRARLAGARTIVARNLDMLAIATAARRMIRPRPRLIYEALDIHDIMTQEGAKGRLARGLERSLLRKTDAIIVSSPAFVREYFKPMQRWSGAVKLIENKLWLGKDGPKRPASDPNSQEQRGKAITLGWVGTLRCPQSFRILLDTADRLGSAVDVRLHGVVHRHMLPDFDSEICGRANISYHGAYEYPDGLKAIYCDCDAVWVQDLWQWGTNSTWLLPNRIYEAGYFGCPSIAVSGTETGRRVDGRLGWTVPEASADALVSLLKELSIETLREQRSKLLAMPDTEFRQTHAEIIAALEP